MKLVLVSGDFETRAPAKTEPPPKTASEIAAMMKRYRASGAGKPGGLEGEEAVAAALAALAEDCGEPQPAEDAAAEEPASS